MNIFHFDIVKNHHSVKMHNGVALVYLGRTWVNTVLEKTTGMFFYFVFWVLFFLSELGHYFCYCSSKKKP